MKRASVTTLIDRLAEINFRWRALLSVLDAGIFSRLYIWLIIVPWFAQFSEKFPSSIDIKPFDSEPIVSITLSLPFSWYVLYFSGISFVIARVIFIYYCPKFLREYENAGDARSKGLTIQYVMNETRDFLANYYRKPRNVSDEEFSRLSDILQQYRIDDLQLVMMKEMQTALGGQLRELLENVVLHESERSSDYYTLGSFTSPLTIEKEQLFKHSFWDLHRFQDAAFPRARLASTFFVALGSALFFFVAFQGLLFVLKQLL